MPRTRWLDHPVYRVVGARVIVAGVDGIDQDVRVLGTELASGLQHPAQKILTAEQDGSYAEGLGVSAALDLVGGYSVAEAKDQIVEGAGSAVGHPNPL